MKSFLIKYSRKAVPEDQWHQDIARFIAALGGDPELAGKISYRCMKSRDGTDYYHLASVVDDAAVKILQSREFFMRYTAQTKAAAGGEVDVGPLQIIAETKFKV